MQEPSPAMQAAIDIGSNTIHIVVAHCKPDDLDIVEDQLALVRIGESVTATGEISPQKRDATIATLQQYKALAEQHSAEHILVVATEAIRQARNSQELLADIQRETGLQVHLISGTAEASLTFYGATYEVAKAPGTTAQIGVMDLGGGSMELVTAKNMHITWRTSIPIGSGWLHDRYLPSNPPTTDELTVAHTFLRTYFQGMRIKHRPPTLIVTGGSANSLLHLVRQAYRLGMDVNHLTSEDLMRCEGLLSALAAEEIAQRYGQEVARARILPAGAMIIREVMARLNLNEIAISPHGIREGVLLAYARYGEQWLGMGAYVERNGGRERSGGSGADITSGVGDIASRVGERVEASTANSNTQYDTDGKSLEHETFIQSGQRMLHERVKKLFDWREEVLKHEDIEAVHKMRVASRRLRATLDAYQSCCDAKQFKKAYRHIKHLADLLGNARDTDVMLQNLHTQLAQVPHKEQAGAQWLIDRLTVYRQEKQEALEKFFETLDEDAFKQQIISSMQEGGAANGKSQTHHRT